MRDRPGTPEPTPRPPSRGVPVWPALSLSVPDRAVVAPGGRRGRSSASTWPWCSCTSRRRTPLSKQHGRAVDDWIYPEFEQNWKLFAPNPLQQNIAVQARAEVARPGRRHRDHRLDDLSAQDGAAIAATRCPATPSRTSCAAAWDFYIDTHDDENRPNGLRGELSERYIRASSMLPSRRASAGRRRPSSASRSGPRTTPVAAPPWSDEKIGHQAALPGAALVDRDTSGQDQARERQPGPAASADAAPRAAAADGSAAARELARGIDRVTGAALGPYQTRRHPDRLLLHLAAVPAARVAAPPGAVRPRRPVELGHGPAADRRTTTPSPR